MKITSFKSAGIVAAVAVVFTIASCKDKGTGTTDASGKQKEVVVSENEKIVFVNSDTLLNKYDYFKDMKTKLETKTKTAQLDFQSKSQAFQREVTQYQQQQNSLPADQRAATEQRLARKQQELQAYQQNAGQALQNEQATENDKLYDKIADYLKTYAKQKGFKLVLTYSKSNPSVLFADESLDITNQVIKGLNDTYSSEKK